MEQKKSGGRAAWITVTAILALLLIVGGLLGLRAYTASRAQLDALTAENAEKDSRIELLNADNAVKDGKIEALSAEGDRKTDQIEALAADNAAKEEQLTDTQTALADTEEQLTAAQTALDETRLELQNTQTEREAAQTELESTQSQLTATQTELESVQDELNETLRQLASAQAELSQTSGELADMRMQVNALAELRFSFREQIRDSVIAAIGDASKVSVDKNGSVILNGSILFDSGKYDIKPEAEPALDLLIDVFYCLLSDENNRSYVESIVISGHTDSDGSEASNREFSTKRANAVLGYLLTGKDGKLNVYADYFCAAGYGETRPIAGNDTPEGKAANRRIEISITLKDDSILGLAERLEAGTGTAVSVPIPTTDPAAAETETGETAQPEITFADDSGEMYSPTASDWEKQNAKLGYTTVDLANLRVGPGTQYKIYLSLRKGEELRILSEEGQWVKVWYDESFLGYIYKDYVAYGAPPAASADTGNAFFALCAAGDLEGARDWLNNPGNSMADRELWLARVNRFLPYAGDWKLNVGDRSLVSYIGGGQDANYKVTCVVILTEEEAILRFLVHPGDTEGPELRCELDETYFYKDRYVAQINPSGNLIVALYPAGNQNPTRSTEYVRARG